MTDSDSSNSKNSWLTILIVLLVIVGFIIVPAASFVAQGHQVERNLRSAHASLTIPEGWKLKGKPHLNSPCPFDLQNNCLSMQVRYSISEEITVDDLLALSPALKQGHGNPDCKRSPNDYGNSTLCSVSGDFEGAKANIFLNSMSVGDTPEVIMNFSRSD